MKPLTKRVRKFQIPQNLQKRKLYPFYQAVESAQDTEVQINGKKVLMFGSNSYLGLANHPEIIKAAQEAISKYGTGTSGSRLMNGNLDIHEELENKLADFVNKQAAIVFSTGFQTNLGTISSIVGRNDIVIIDEKSHASIIEGSRLAFAKAIKYKHNDMFSLEQKLKNSSKYKVKLIVTDGIFSMEGDIAKLDKISELAHKYSASIMVDDAHALGVIGKNGSGTASYFNLTDETDLIMGTFSKSLASVGGFIAGNHETINYLKHKARSLLFSASLPPTSVATVLKALEIIKSEPERISALWNNTNYAINQLKEKGFNIGNSSTPIIPIFIGDDMLTYKYAAELLKKGIYVNAIVHPAVNKKDSILRFSLMATHTKHQIDVAVNSLIECRNYIENQPVLEHRY